MKTTKRDIPKHPRQPTIIDKHGVKRFKENAIVSALLDAATDAKIMDMNKIACMGFSKEDRQQFAQLIGYSVSGYGELSYVEEEDGCQCEVHKAVREEKNGD